MIDRARTRHRVRRRDGFAMITMLWLIAIASVMTMTAALAGRNAVNATRNRVQLERAHWRAEGCARRAESAIDAALRDAERFNAGAERWRVLDGVVRAADLPPDCGVDMEAAGTKLDLNGASDEMLARALAGLGYGEQSDVMVAALADWRDSDDDTRAGGAERDWYAAAHRLPPRNGPLADVGELSRVRGFETIPDLAAVFSTEPGRVSLATAPVAVLLAVPGITPDAADAIVAFRVAGAPIGDLSVLADVLPRAPKDELIARYADAVRVSTPDPDAWILTASVSTGFPASTAAVRWRLIRSGGGATIVSSRDLP